MAESIAQEAFLTQKSHFLRKMTVQKPLKSIENDPGYIKRIFFTDETRLEIDSGGRKGNKGMKINQYNLTIIEFR